MNCFTHALPHLEDPYMAVGVCLPDWLSAADRKCRAREKKALPFVDHGDPIVATTAKGVVRHHADDGWFHATPTFNELILKFAVQLREVFGNERTMRPSFIGHIVIEMLLDAYLHNQNSGKLDFFYAQVAKVDGEAVQDAINQFATRPTDKLATEIKRFTNERYLYDYETDEGTVYRINKVLKRIKLEPLGNEICDWLPDARTQVYDRAAELLPEYPLEV